MLTHMGIKKGIFCMLAGSVLMLLHVQPVCAEEISKEFRSDIVRLLKVTGAEALGIQMGVALTNQMMDSMVKQNPGIPQKTVVVVKDEINKVFTEEMPKLMTEIVPVYAKHFTHDEIKGLIAFYATPLGKKAIQEMPAVMSECMGVGQAWGRRFATEIGPRLESRLKKEGLDDIK